MFNFTAMQYPSLTFAELISDGVIYEVLIGPRQESTYIGAGIICSATNRWQIEDTTRQYANGKTKVYQAVNSDV